MFEPIVYRAERAAGIEEAIRKSRSVAFLAQARLVRDGHVPAHVRATAGLGDVDVRFIEGVLTTAGENKNQDVVLAEELWQARATPTSKMVNLNHDDGAVIGSMVSARAVDGHFTDVPDDTPLEELPADLQLVVGCVLWTKWATPSRQERMNTLLEEVDAGKYALSMEVLFTSHAYLLTSASGSTEVVERSEATAHMSKYLAAYGGTGVYAGRAIGRVLCGCCFSGVALTKSPACDGAVILRPPVEQAIASWYESGRQVQVATAARPTTAVQRDIYEFLAGW